LKDTASRHDESIIAVAIVKSKRSVLLILDRSVMNDEGRSEVGGVALWMSDMMMG
jgi:hypothetical protein